MGGQKTKVKEELSLDDIRQQVQIQVRDIVPQAERGEFGPYIVEIFMTYAIIEFEGGEYYRVPFGQDGAQVSVAPRSEWKKVDQAWVAAESKKHQKGLRTAALHEAVDLTEATLDEEKRTVRNVTLISAGWSLNDRYYPEKTLSEAVPLFNGVKAYADHPTRSQAKEQPGRSIFELAGWYENVRMEGNRMKGDFFVEDERVWPKVRTAVTTKPGYVDLSINGLGKTSLGEAEGRKGPIVEAITHANSCDVVTSGAAGGGFAGSTLLNSSDDGWLSAILNTIDLQEFREARPDLVESLKTEWKTVRDTQALADERDKNVQLGQDLKAAQATVTAATEQIRALKRELHEARADRLLDATSLPTEWKQSLRAEMLATDLTEWPSLIDREVQKAASVPSRRRVTVTGAGALAPPQPSREMLEAYQNDPNPRRDENYQQWLARTGHQQRST